MGLGVRCFRRMWVVGYEIFCEGYGQVVDEREYGGMNPLLCASQSISVRGGVISF